MGLDMYLTKRTFVGAQYEHRQVDAKIEISVDGRSLSINPRKISRIDENVGYWRKANAIHAWFVKNVQGGVDECQEVEVSWGALQELKALCEQILVSRDASLLPPQGGFFFGSTEIDEGYFDDLRATIEIIDSLQNPAPKFDSSYVYQSSW